MLNGIKQKYWIELIFPICWLIFMNLALVIKIVPDDYADYFYCLYFGGFFIYFVFVLKTFSWKEWMSNIRQWKFLKFVFVTILGMGGTYGIGSLLTILFSNYNISFVSFSPQRAYNTPTKVAFFFASVIFPPLGQEFFYRKLIIRFDSKYALIVSTAISCVLFGINDNLDLLGILKSSFFGFALAISYIKTKNIYVPLSAHYVANIIIPLVF